MRVPVPEEVLPAAELGRVHFVGIGGAGLSAIARLMNEQGVGVSGSDQQDSKLLAELRAEGIDCYSAHHADNVAGKDTVIVSTAIGEGNPEVIAARASGLRLWPRSTGLMSAMMNDERIAVAGTHGKTTTTAMLTLAMHAADKDVSFSIGAHVPALGTNARRGSAGIMVVESDESDGAFLHYAPHRAIITNIDADHLDSWQTEAAYEAAFASFAQSVAGDVVVCADDPGCRRLIQAQPRRLIPVGFGDKASIKGRNLQVTAQGTRFDVELPGHDAIEVSLVVSGAHYAVDALLALVCAWRSGADPLAAARGLADYTGASRRMEFKGHVAGVSVTDSYAHHPTEIAADLAAARAIAGDRRLVVVFQPHLVSRTRVFGQRMGEELSQADAVWVADIYLAREEADPKVDANLVVEAVTGVPASAGGPVEGLAERLLSQVRSGDYVLTLGAGDITKVGPELLDLLAKQGAAGGA